MNKIFRTLLTFAAALMLASGPALPQTPVSQAAPPWMQSGDRYVQSFAVTGGSIYSAILRSSAGITESDVFVPTVSPGGATRGLNLVEAKSDPGVAITAAAGTPAGAVGISRTAGASMALVGETTSSSAKTNKALFETNIATTYTAGSNIAVTVNCNYTGGGTITALSTTMAVAAYTESAGVETALTVSAAQQMGAAAGNLVFTITGAGLTPGQHIVLELTMLVTSSAGSNTGQINAVSYVG